MMAFVLLILVAVPNAVTLNTDLRYPSREACEKAATELRPEPKIDARYMVQVQCVEAAR